MWGHSLCRLIIKGAPIYRKSLIFFVYTCAYAALAFIVVKNGGAIYG